MCLTLTPFVFCTFPKSPSNCVWEHDTFASAHNYFFLGVWPSWRELQAKVKTREQTAVRTLSSLALARWRHPTFCKHALSHTQTSVCASRILIQLLVNARGLLSSDTNTLAREHLHCWAERSKHYYNVILPALRVTEQERFVWDTMLELRAFHFNSREISSRAADSLF